MTIYLLRLLNNGTDPEIECHQSVRSPYETSDLFKIHASSNE